MKNKFSLLTIVMIVVSFSSQSQTTGTFTDSRDKKVYKTVTIGTQTWMAENLAYKSESGCWIYGNKKNFLATYGYLYNWETAKTSCPKGWHLPGDDEWTMLTNLYGGGLYGGKLKESGTSHWKETSDNVTNESGFTALPGGYRMSDGSCGLLTDTGYWWSATEDSPGKISFWSVNCFQNIFKSHLSSGEYGYSVRCVRD